MTLEALRRIASIHGLAAWISAALLGLSAALLARARAAPVTRPTLAVSVLATALAAAVSGLGMVLHEPYLNRLRQRIFVKDPALGWLFERKSHFAFGSLGLAFCALASLAALVFLERRLARPGASPNLPPSLRSAALTAYAASAALALVACVLSSLVARRFSF